MIGSFACAGGLRRHRAALSIGAFEHNDFSGSRSCSCGLASSSDEELASARRQSRLWHGPLACEPAGENAAGPAVYVTFESWSEPSQVEQTA